jgi:hypothetical protein
VFRIVGTKQRKKPLVSQNHSRAIHQAVNLLIRKRAHWFSMGG